MPADTQHAEWTQPSWWYAMKSNFLSIYSSLQFTRKFLSLDLLHTISRLLSSLSPTDVAKVMGNWLKCHFMEMKVVHSFPTLSHSSLSDWDISVWLVVASGLTKKHEAEINMLLLLLEQAFKHIYTNPPGLWKHLASFYTLTASGMFLEWSTKQTKDVCCILPQKPKIISKTS